MSKLVFKPNPVQQQALEHLYDPKNDDGEPWDPNDPPAIELVHENGKLQLVVSEAYLRENGEWATFPEPSTEELKTYAVNAALTLESTGDKVEIEEAIFDLLKTFGPRMDVSQVEVHEQTRSAA
jgi:hypothetical protein